jgi:hypothetical protein
VRLDRHCYIASASRGSCDLAWAVCYTTGERAPSTLIARWPESVPGSTDLVAAAICGCVRSHSRPNARIMEVERRLGASIMRHALFGLTLLPLIACGTAAGESVAPNSASSVSQNVAPSPPHRAHRAKNSKYGSGTQSGGSPVPRSLPLSTATAYTAEHSPSFPISTVPKATPESNSWSGFFVGVGAGAGTQP